MLQSKLIFEKKNLSQHQDIQRFPKSYPYSSLTKWDIILLQTKYFALDFHEERKRKRTFAFLFSHSLNINIGEKRAKKNAIDSLYKNCYTLYSSINQGNNLSEFSEENKNAFNDLLKPNNLNEYENMKEELFNWKKQIKNLENRLNQIKSNIQLEGENVQKFFDIFSLIKSIIGNQEEKLKEMQESKKNEGFQNMSTFGGSLSDIANLLKDSNNIIPRQNKNATIIADKSNINYNKVNSNISEIIKQIVNEFNKQVLLIGETNISKNKIKNKSNNNNEEINQISNENINNNEMIIEDEEKEFDMMLNKGLNPAKLILNIKDEMTQEDLIKNFKINLEIENCFVLPMYNYDKLLKIKLDLNSVEYNPDNSYFRVFPQIENDEKKFAAKKLMEIIDPVMNNSIKKKPNQELNDKNLRYDKLTPLQKLIILYGIFASGNNPSLVNSILNIYFPTHCMMYNNDEMNYICKKILEEIGIEYESGFNNMKDDEIFNFNKSMKFYLNNSQKMDIESSLFITEFNDFKYNETIKKIYDLKEDKKGEEFSKIFNEIKNADQYKLNSEFNIKNKNISLQRSKNLLKILINNPYIKNEEIKKKLLKDTLNYLKSICLKIKTFQENNRSSYNYFTGEISMRTKRRINDMNYPEIIENKKKKLDKNSVLENLREYKGKIKFNIKEMKKDIIKNEENNFDDSVKNKILNVINLYNANNIKNEWERNRKEWYQNNQRFNPIFKINDKEERKNYMIIQKNRIQDNGRFDNDGNNKNNNENNLFSNINRVQVNQP